MLNSRLESLLKFLEEDPHDAFTHYALAKEYEKFDLKQAVWHYTFLLEQQPDYLPTYYHAAKLREALKEPEEAKKIYVKGIALAKVQQNAPALRELQNALGLIEADEED